MHNTLAKKQNYIKYERSEQNSKTKNKIMTNHRPSISTDFSLSLEFGNIMINNKPKNNNNSNLNNLQINKNRLIKVNTKRNNYAHTLSIRDDQNNTNKKIDKNLNNIEKNELFQNISEINIFQNMRKEKEKTIDELNNEQYKCNMNKIIHIQKWWKNIFIIKKKIINSLNTLIKIIKKFVLCISYNSIKNTFPNIKYFFYKWHNTMTKRIILNKILNNGFQIQKVKKTNKEKQNILNDSKKNKNIHNNKKK